MRCIKCGRIHNGTYGQRCEDCWAVGQVAVGATAGIPGLSGLSGDFRPEKETIPSHPDFAAIARFGVVAVM